MRGQTQIIIGRQTDAASNLQAPAYPGIFQFPQVTSYPPLKFVGMTHGIIVEIISKAGSMSLGMCGSVRRNPKRESKAWSRSVSGLAVVSSRSPMKMEFAPARKQSA